MSDDETPKERVDRELGELLQGLRVAVTGVQVLFAFLLTVPFASGAGRVTGAHGWLFYVALLGAAVASVAYIAPAAQHRILFRTGNKEALLRRSNRFGVAGSLSLGTSMTAAAALVVDVLFDARLAVVTGAVIAALALWAWLVEPLLTRAWAADSPPRP
ncbi:MAG: hypothetical protein GEV03_20835 [Streptosporangiales bacterium]|nr:hypothetical protein [Streptosporangiales bacterium]